MWSITEIQFCRGSWDRLTELPKTLEIYAKKKKNALSEQTLFSVTKP